VRDHGADASILEQCTQEEDYTQRLDNGNEIVVTAEYFLFVVGENGGELIKSNVEVAFGKGEDKDCSKFKKELRDRKIFYRDSMGVHPQTLKAFIGECMGRGIKVPSDMFKLYTGQKVQIRRP
jgi:hypothetical protein